TFLRLAYSKSSNSSFSVSAVAAISRRLAFSFIQSRLIARLAADGTGKGGSVVNCRFWWIEDSVRVAPNGSSGARRRGFPRVIPNLRSLAQELIEATHVLSTRSIEQIVE